MATSPGSFITKAFMSLNAFHGSFYEWVAQVSLLRPGFSGRSRARPGSLPEPPLLLILRPARRPGIIEHRSQNGFNLSQQRPIGPILQQFQACLRLPPGSDADEGARHEGMAQSETQSQLRDIPSLFAAKYRSLSARFAHLRRRRVPIRRPLFRQQTHTQTGRIDQPDAMLPRELGQNPSISVFRRL